RLTVGGAGDMRIQSRRSCKIVALAARALPKGRSPHASHHFHPVLRNCPDRDPGMRLRAKHSARHVGSTLMLWTAPTLRHRSAIDWFASKPERLKEVRLGNDDGVCSLEGIGEDMTT